MSDGVEFGILGPLEVRTSGRAATVAAPKQRALLALLLLHANEVVPRDRIAEELWPGVSPASVVRALHVHVSSLRRELGPEGAALVVTRSPGYVLRLDPHG